MESLEDITKTTISLETKHKKEKKELQAQIQALKKAAKNDKSKKKDLLSQIARLESVLDDRHKQELEAEQKATIHEKNDVENQETENSVTKLKISKAQRRRDKKSQLDKRREELIKQEQLENLHGPRHKEIQEISSKLKQQHLKIYPIASDGNCLYKAVAHQLNTKRNFLVTAEHLRNLAASFMRENKDDFMPFMSDPDTDQMLTDEQFETYCDKVCNTTMWGGQLEIKALSSSLKCPIIVIQATGPESIEQGIEFSGPSLIITYHRHMYRLGEHYNSTCVDSEIDDDE